MAHNLFLAEKEKMRGEGISATQPTSISMSSPSSEESIMELNHTAHKVSLNVHHLQWCTKYRYKMFRQEEYKKLCEEILREAAMRHQIAIRELFVMPEHIHISVEVPPSMSQSKALQLLKGNLSYRLFRREPKFRLRYPKDISLVQECMLGVLVTTP